LLNAVTMGVCVAKIICFRCRRSDCGCTAPERTRLNATWAFAWLGGACLAGTTVGAILALLLS
jgi:hypothetical protein